MGWGRLKGGDKREEGEWIKQPGSPVVKHYNFLQRRSAEEVGVG